MLLLMLIRTHSYLQQSDVGGQKLGGLQIQLAVSMFALAAFQFHLVRRLVETVAVMVYPSTARMHVIAYIFGLSYYLIAPLSLIPQDLFKPAIGPAAAQAYLGLSHYLIAPPLFDAPTAL
eukprot:gene12252-15397_t